MKPFQEVFEEHRLMVMTVFTRAQREVRQKLMQRASLTEVLDALIRVVEEAFPDLVGSVLQVNERECTLQHLSAPSLPEAYCKLVNGINIGPGAGSCGTAAFTRQRVVIDDIATDPFWKDFRVALEHNLRACWSEPILSSAGDKVLGTVAFYLTAPRSPGDEDLHLLEMVSQLAGMVMEGYPDESREQQEAELKQANEELRALNAELERRLDNQTDKLSYQNQITQTITDNATAALFMMDARGYCTFLNPAAEAMTGYTLDEIRQKPLHYMVHHTRPDGTPFPLEECPIDRALPTNNNMRAHEETFVRRDGSFFPVSCAARPIFERGFPVGTVVEVRDVTEEKKVQLQILESRERLRFLLEAIPNLAWTATPDGQIDFFNQRWYEYTGLGEKEGMGDGWQSVIHPLDIPDTLAGWAEAIEFGTLFEKENRFRQRSDGMYRWHLVRGVPIKVDQGRTIMWVGTCTDIHLQKMAMVNLAETQQALWATNKELSRTNAQLMRTNSDLDSFVYTASHDLKAPISNLEGLVYALQEELAGSPGEVLELLELVSLSVNRLTATISELTEISRIQKDTQGQLEMVSLEELVQDLAIDFAEIIRTTEAQVTTDFDEVKAIRFSRKYLRSILYNLLSNGLKYRSVSRPPEIRISAREVPGGYVLLSVQDNGLGIRAEHREQVFSMFKRMHHHVDGTGVGLYIVKRIVENAGGSVAVESELDKGSEFKLYLPL